MIDWNGHPPLSVTRRKLRACAKTVASETACYITATTDGVHSANSYHYQGRAIDWGSNRPDNGPEMKAQTLLRTKFGAKAFKELLGPCNWHIFDGQVITGTYTGHGDHLHAAI